MRVDSLNGINIGNCIIVHYGPYRMAKGVVVSIAIDEGARNGWFTVQFPNGDKTLFAGEEISLAQE